jgi:hypothetical protein
VARPRRLVPVAAVVAVAVFIWAGPIATDIDGSTPNATVSLTDVTPPPQRTADAEIRIDPPEAAKDARWLTITGWQGNGSHLDRLERVGEGVYRSTKPVPLYGNWKTTLRLHKDDAVLGAAIFFPADPAIPAPEVKAEPTFTRPFVEDKKLLQREQKPGVSGALTGFAYFVVLAIALGLVASLAKGLTRFDKISQQNRMKPGMAVHETQIGSKKRFERDGMDGSGNGDGDRAKADKAASKLPSG